jgi:Cytochrome P450
MEFNHAVERVGSPGAYLGDTIPALKYLPGFLAPFKHEAKELHEREIDLFRSLLLDAKKQIEKGNSPQCFSETFLESQDEHGLLVSIEEATYVLGTSFEAGSGTTGYSCSYTSFYLACLYPEWQTKAQHEIYEVCGRGMPEFDDIPKPPMVRAVIKEVTHWRPV